MSIRRTSVPAKVRCQTSSQRTLSIARGCRASRAVRFSLTTLSFLPSPLLTVPMCQHFGGPRRPSARVRFGGGFGRSGRPKCLPKPSWEALDFGPMCPQNCWHMGIVSKGEGFWPEKRQLLFEKLSARPGSWAPHQQKAWPPARSVAPERCAGAMLYVAGTWPEVTRRVPTRAPK